MGARPAAVARPLSHTPAPHLAISAQGQGHLHAKRAPQFHGVPGREEREEG